jgi:hypothetical protein
MLQDKNESHLRIPEKAAVDNLLQAAYKRIGCRLNSFVLSNK